MDLMRRRSVKFAAMVLCVGASVATCDANTAEKIACSPPPLNTDTNVVDAVSGGATAVYADASGSMGGYLHAGTAPGDNLYRDIVLSLPDLVDGGMSFARFGERIDLIGDGRRAREAATPEFYRSSLSQSSRIHLVFEKAADAPAADLTIVVTDLFLSGDDVNPESGPLRRPLARALEQGKAVAILGIVSRYHGRIDGRDLPSGKAFPAPRQGAPRPVFEGFHPFYLVMIGPETRIVAFYRRIKRDILAEAPPDRQGFILFSQDMVGPVEVQQKPLAQIGERGIIEREIIRNQPNFPQYIIERGDLRLQDHPLVLTLNLAPIKTPPRPGYAMTEGLELSTELYQYKDPDSLCLRREIAEDSQKAKAFWSGPRKESAAQLSYRDEEGSVDVALLAPLLMRLPRDQVFLLDMTITARRARQQGGAVDWLRSWSFDAKSEAQMRATVEVAAPQTRRLPTLNLWPLSQRLLEIVGEKYPGEPVARARLAFRIE